VVDVGCGIGGSARYLARRYEAKVSAINLSPVQAARGDVITASQGLTNLVRTSLLFQL
jgi:tocopherol O-methyltransferase